ncbi:hypothetical protein I79_009800 [Cricetulus griseus]|uniref:Uncharacterized protein n=1 Tax=Cricetulus griseus TaxID=10029 RepID=G3HGR1_CRIGR|nr:hypothetical protein I79_009800 [Cricetulus griseus]
MPTSPRAPGSLTQSRRANPVLASQTYYSTRVWKEAMGKSNVANRTVMGDMNTLHAAGQVALPLWVSI